MKNIVSVASRRRNNKLIYIYVLSSLVSFLILLTNEFSMPQFCENLGIMWWIILFLCIVSFGLFCFEAWKIANKGKPDSSRNVIH